MKTPWDKRVDFLVNALQSYRFLDIPVQTNGMQGWLDSKVRWFSEADSRGHHRVYHHPEWNDITMRRAGDPISDRVRPMQEIVPGRVHLEFRYCRFGSFTHYEGRWTMSVDKNLMKNMTEFMPHAIDMAKARAERVAEEARLVESSSRERELYSKQLRELLPGLRNSEIWNNGTDRRGIEFKLSIEGRTPVEVAQIIAAIRQIPGVKTPFPDLA